MMEHPVPWSLFTCRSKVQEHLKYSHWLNALKSSQEISPMLI